MPVLGGRLELHDVHDVERYCAGLLDNWLRGRGCRLNAHAYEDALSFLIATAWELSERFDGRGSFAGYCSMILSRRLVDWFRRRFGDSRRVTARGETTLASGLEEALARVPADDDPVDELAVARADAALALRRAARDGDVARRLAAVAPLAAGVPVDELARRLGCSRGSVRRELSRLAAAVSDAA